MRGRVIAAFSAAGFCLAAGLAAFQNPMVSGFGGTFLPSPDHRAIQYTARSAADRISRLNQRLNNRQTRLTFDPVSGYLGSLLQALDVPVESQMAVFSKTSLQSSHIRPDSPRLVYFSDEVMVAWPRGGFIEAAAIDPEQGPIFYTLQQSEVSLPGLVRNNSCLSCHVASATLGVPGPAAASVVPDAEGFVATDPFFTDHRSPFAERFGGWYVTGQQVPMAHMGNLVAADPSHPTLTVTKDSSDIVALMVFDHQAMMTNLMTRLGWEVRVALARDPSGDARLRADLAGWVRELVDYLLFVDEAVPDGAIQGASGFAEKFANLGPRDRQGRALRDLDLKRRLMKYPCSYLIYSDQFDHLPPVARDAIYKRMWEILSGADHTPRYARLSAADRLAIVEILRDTKKGLGF